MVIGHISQNRQKLLMKHLEDLPSLDEHFGKLQSSYSFLLIDFPLSRRESTVSQVNNSNGANTAQDCSEVSQRDKRVGAGASKLDWMGDLKKTHEKFTFTPAAELSVKSLL